MLIRRERPEDVDVIGAVHEAAFAPFADGGSPGEPGLVTALRVSNDWIPALAVVAEGDDGTVVGHVCVTRGRLNGRPALALGPIGVLPGLQRHGVGSALMHAVIGAADALGESTVLLLGHTDYYPKFGFVPAEDCGISPDVEEWAGPHFQVRRLTAYDPTMRGVFRYPQAFYDL